MQINHFSILCISTLLWGCIGKNPDDATSTTTTPETTPPTTSTSAPPTTTGTKATTAGAIGVEPAIYKVRTQSNRQLQTYFQGYTKNNVTLDKRDEDATDSHLSDILDKLPLWSADTTKWTDQFDTPTGTPPDSVNIHIVNDKGGSVIAADRKHIVQNLQMDADTGLFIPAEKSILATKVTMGKSSWIDVRGIMGSERFDMAPNSILDLTNGYGLLLDSKLSEIKYDAKIDPTGVLTLKPDGELRVDNGTITLHKADIQGSLGVNNATVNFQTRRDLNTANIGFFQTKGKIYALDSENFPDILMTVNGPFQFKSGSEIEILINTDTASKIILNFPFSFTGNSDKPVIEGKFRFIPKDVEALASTTGDGMLVVNSNIGFPANMDLSQLIADNTVLKKKLTLTSSSIDDEKYKQRQGIFLKIENTSSALALKASLPIQTALTSLKHNELKAAVWNTAPSQVVSGAFSTTEFFMTNSIFSNHEISASSKLFGLNHNINLPYGNLVMTQLYNRAQITDRTYRFIPQAQTPFWMMQHKITFQMPVNLGNITLTPSTGIAQTIIPETIFQNEFQTLNPEASLKCGITHIVDSSTLSLNLVINTFYKTFNETPSWNLDSGFNINFNTPLLNISTGVISPFQSHSEIYLNAEIFF